MTERKSFPTPNRSYLVLQQTTAHGIFNQLSSTVQVELIHNMGAVSVDGLGADEEQFANLAVGKALGNQFENLPFALS